MAEVDERPQAVPWRFVNQHVVQLLTVGIGRFVLVRPQAAVSRPLILKSNFCSHSKQHDWALRASRPLDRCREGVHALAVDLE